MLRVVTIFTTITNKSIKRRLTIRSSFDSNFRNRLDLTILTLGIDLKSNSISIILESIRLDSTRFSISILGIESNRQECQEYRQEC